MLKHLSEGLFVWLLMILD